MSGGRERLIVFTLRRVPASDSGCCLSLCSQNATRMGAAEVLGDVGVLSVRRRRCPTAKTTSFSSQAQFQLLSKPIAFFMLTFLLASHSWRCLLCLESVRRWIEDVKRQGRCLGMCAGKLT